MKANQNTSMKALTQFVETEPATVAKRGRLALRSEDRARAIAFSEALRAISLYVGGNMASPPRAQLLEVLECAYRELGTVLEDFTPQDFTLYAMSLLLSDLDNEDEAVRLKQGASQYLLHAGPQLSRQLKNLVPDEQVSLRSAPASFKSQRPSPDTKKRLSLSHRRLGSVNASQSGNDQSKSGTSASRYIGPDTLVFKHAPVVSRPHAPQTAERATVRLSAGESETAAITFETARTRGKNGLGLSLMIVIFSLILAAFSING